ncbi:hypothetical protein APS56_02845 [Pseudalgibacter alginicilyticus]|uniref:Uncharacterized protein n=1 Tax=Pseudalgibacter alginicilyticus TaxID=1736674 RepID=A0A0P0D2R3_9FLAO|nr:hypothetical protein [Pseudalgibacter alginicilyticus]ALJ04151.1 hypothetical protein APS56_02845 [Pseudalgibacter alginicilyticus]
MKHLEVLVVAKHTGIPKILNWKVTVENRVETVVEKLYQIPYKVVAISDELADTDKLKLIKIISLLFNELIWLTYHDKTALAETVKTAYWTKKRPSSNQNYLDNLIEIKLAHNLNLKKD